MFPQAPAIDGLTWSIEIADLTSDEVLHTESPDALCQTASMGKVFLLIAACTRFADGCLDPGARLEVPAEHEVADSGLLYLFRDRGITLADACLLVGAVSDNLATNGLIHAIGLDEVRAVSTDLGYERTGLLDFIRNGRTPDMPWAASAGCAAEYRDVFARLHRGEVVSAEVSAQVLSFLAADVDTSMVAGGLHLDPLAHIEADDEITLRHKTGSVSNARIDAGVVTGPAGGLTYAVAANWDGNGPDLRVEVEEHMRALGAAIRKRVRP